MEKTAAQIISEIGVAEIAQALGKEPAAVRMWKHRNNFPRQVWPELAEAFPNLTLERLKQIEALRGAAA